MKRKFHFCINTAAQLDLFRETATKIFDSLEISGDLLAEMEAVPKDICIYSVRDLISPVLARLITFENLSMQIKFGQLLRNQIKLAVDCGATAGSIDFDLPEIIGDAEKEKKFSLLLKGLSGIAANFKFKLLLQLRIPGAASIDTRQLLRFKQNLLYPGFGYIFDFHPHEPGAFDFENEVGNLPFDTGSWRLSFELDKGNIPTHALMEKLIAMTDHSLLPSGDFFISPGKAELDIPLLEKLYSTIEPFDEKSNI